MRGGTDFRRSRPEWKLFLAFSPNGKAVYSSGEEYVFVPLGRTFPAVSVSRRLASSASNLFFADC